MGRWNPSWIIAATLCGAIVTGCSGRAYQWGWYEVLPLTAQGQSNLMFLIKGLWL